MKARAAITIAALAAMVDAGGYKPVRSASPKREEEGIEDTPPKQQEKKESKSSKGLKGAGQHALAVVEQMGEQVMATYQTIDSDEAGSWAYALGENTRDIDWSQDEQEVETDLLLLDPADVNHTDLTARMNFEPSNWNAETVRRRSASENLWRRSK